MRNSKSFDQIRVHDYDRRIEMILVLLHNEVSAENFRLVQRYDDVMIREALSKATRLKQLQTVLSLTRLLQKDWSQVTKSDIDSLVATIMKEYSSQNGQETYSSWDHKKILPTRKRS